MEIVRRIYEAVARRDTAGILELYDPAIEIQFFGDTLAEHITGETGAVWVGHEGLRTFDRELRQAFADFETNCEELIEVGDKVVSTSRYRGRGLHSGVEIDGPPQFGVWTIRDGKVTRAVWFATREEAVAAAERERLVD